jgi:hypothetical protein
MNIKPKCSNVYRSLPFRTSYCANYEYNNYIIKNKTINFGVCPSRQPWKKLWKEGNCYNTYVYDSSQASSCWNTNVCNTYYAREWRNNINDYFSGKNINTCYYVCENPDMLKSITINNLEIYYPTSLDYNKNIEQFFKNYYLNNVGELIILFILQVVNLKWELMISTYFNEGMLLVTKNFIKLYKFIYKFSIMFSNTAVRLMKIYGPSGANLSSLILKTSIIKPSFFSVLIIML